LLPLPTPYQAYKKGRNRRMDKTAKQGVPNVTGIVRSRGNRGCIGMGEMLRAYSKR
jgi:hypothetical protein